MAPAFRRCRAGCRRDVSHCRSGGVRPSNLGFDRWRSLAGYSPHGFGESRKAAETLSPWGKVSAPSAAIFQLQSACRAFRSAHTFPIRQTQAMQTPPYFLNVDLDVRSTSDLGPLMQAMGRRVAVLHCGPVGSRYLLAIETARTHKNPDANVHAMCAIVESLSRPARRLWNAAEKQFDIGYEIGSEHVASRFTLRNDTVQRIARLGASLAITHYSPDPERAALNSRKVAKTPR